MSIVSERSSAIRGVVCLQYVVSHILKYNYKHEAVKNFLMLFFIYVIVNEYVLVLKKFIIFCKFY